MPRKKYESKVIKRTELMRMGEVVRLGPERPTMTFEFRMPPLPKGRPRSFLQGGKLVVTKDQRSRDYEHLIAEVTAMQYDNTTPLEGDLIATVSFYLKNRIHGDLDNLLKAILDGMQGVAFHNDKQVRGFTVEAFYFDELPSHERIERTIVVLSHRDREKSPDAQTVVRDSKSLKRSLSIEGPKPARKPRGKATPLIDFGALTDEVDREAVEVCDIGERLKAGKCASPDCKGTIKSGSCKCPVIRRQDFRGNSGDALIIPNG